MTLDSDNYWDSEYPTHIEIPEDYWIWELIND